MGNKQEWARVVGGSDYGRTGKASRHFHLVRAIHTASNPHCALLPLTERAAVELTSKPARHQTERKTFHRAINS